MPLPNPPSRDAEASQGNPQPQFPRIIPGLDGLRGVALIAVIVTHQYFDVFKFGWIPLQMFFVLSGFLISLGLLQARSRPFAEYLRVFYWHRALRIFPPYYLYLAVLSVVALFVTMQGTGPVSIACAATYVYNFYHASEAFEASYTLTHFWSLAVEEQFYFVCPLLLFFVSGTALRRVLWAIVIAGPLVRALTYAFLLHTSLPVLREVPLSIYVLPWSHFDAFAVGIFISLGVIRGSGRLAWLALASAGALGLAQYLVFPEIRVRSLGYPFTMGVGYQFVWGYTVVNLVSAFIVVAVGKREFLPWLFENRFLSYLGRISYAMYILHYSIQSLLRTLLPEVPVVIQLVIQVALATALASLSQRYIEAPARQLRGRFWGSAQPLTRPHGPLLRSDA